MDLWLESVQVIQMKTNWFSKHQPEIRGVPLGAETLLFFFVGLKDCQVLQRKVSSSERLERVKERRCCIAIENDLWLRTRREVWGRGLWRSSSIAQLQVGFFEGCQTLMV